MNTGNDPTNYEVLSNPNIPLQSEDFPIKESMTDAYQVEIQQEPSSKPSKTTKNKKLVRKQTKLNTYRSKLTQSNPSKSTKNPKRPKTSV